MPVHKSLKNGDVILKFKVPVAKSLTMRAFHAENDHVRKESMPLTSFLDHILHSPYLSNNTYFHQSFYTNLSQVTGPFRNDESRKRTLAHRIHSNTSKVVVDAYEQFSKDALPTIVDSLFVREHIGYHHFVLVLGSKLARSRGTKLPAFFEPFLSSIGINIMHQYNRDLIYKNDEFLFNMFFGRDDGRYAALTTKQAYVAPPALRGTPFDFSTFAMDIDPNFMEIIERQRNYLNALGLSLHMVYPEVYEQISLPEIVQEKLQTMPHSFTRGFNALQTIPLNDDRYIGALNDCLSVLAKTDSDRNYFIGNNMHSTVENFHLLDDDERRKNFITLYNYYMYLDKHEKYFSIFHSSYRSRFNLQSLPVAPKKTLPSIELVET